MPRVVYEETRLGGRGGMWGGRGGDKVLARSAFHSETYCIIPVETFTSTVVELLLCV